VAAAAALPGSDRVSRAVATGNGAADHVAHALWLASLDSRGAGLPIVAVPCGLAARPAFRWRPGDALLAVSSSGEFRKVVELARSTRPGAGVDRESVRGEPARGAPTRDESIRDESVRDNRQVDL
jgi:hypothetical protein